VPTALLVFPLASQRHPSEILQPLCSTEDICTVLGVWVSKWKCWELLEKGRWSNKMVRIEDELRLSQKGVGWVVERLEVSRA